jgi:hypothetical protein
MSTQEKDIITQEDSLNNQISHVSLHEHDMGEGKKQSNEKRRIEGCLCNLKLQI